MISNYQRKQIAEGRKMKPEMSLWIKIICDFVGIAHFQKINYYRIVRKNIDMQYKISNH